MGEKHDPLLDDQNDNVEEVKSTETKQTEPAEVKSPDSGKTEIKVKGAAWGKDTDTAEETKKILAKKPHTNFIVPLGEHEKEGAVEEVQINGYKFTIKKGVLVNIPVPVANLIAEKYKINMEAGKDKLADRASDVSEALGR